jgi:PhoH-like ATPase
VARLLDSLRLRGVLTNGGVPLENGGHLRVVFSGSFLFDALPPELRTPTVDNQILALALHEDKRGRHPVVVVTKDINLRIFDPPREGFWGIFSRNREQKFALDLLSNPGIHLVTLVGKAGTGKTLLAIAAGLHCVTEMEHYSRLLVSRLVFPMRRDLGFLPGDVEEKLAPWMQPIYDNVDLLLNGGGLGIDRKKRGYQELKDMGVLEVEPLTFIRGRSIPRQFIIVDEAQNLTPHEVKTIITRAGEGAKVVLTGDPEQIDNPYVDASSNGLTYVVERFKKSPISGHITLRKGERSQLAEAASHLL